MVASLVAPGGFLYLSEFHPFSWVFAEDELRVENDYFPARLEFDEPGTYADLGAATVHNRTEEWQHTLGDIVSAVTAAGPAAGVAPRARSHALAALGVPGARRARHLAHARGAAANPADVLAARPRSLAAGPE